MMRTLYSGTTVNDIIENRDNVLYRSENVFSTNPIEALLHTLDLSKEYADMAIIVLSGVELDALAEKTLQQERGLPIVVDEAEVFYQNGNYSSVDSRVISAGLLSFYTGDRIVTRLSEKSIQNRIIAYQKHPEMPSQRENSLDKFIWEHIIEQGVPGGEQFFSRYLGR